jgi:hypothetical protein
MRSMIAAMKPPNQMAAHVHANRGFAKRRRDYNRVQELEYYMVPLSLLSICVLSLYTIPEKTIHNNCFLIISSIVMLVAHLRLHSVYESVPNIPSLVLFVPPISN